MITSTPERADWQADPTGRYELRYWDGAHWTPWVSVGGRQFLEPAGGPSELAATTHAPTRDPTLHWLLPIGRSPWAIAAGYAGLFAFVIVPAPLALALGVVALVSLQRHPEQLGRGRAIFGVTVGALGTVVLLALAVANLSVDLPGSGSNADAARVRHAARALLSARSFEFVASGGPRPDQASQASYQAPDRLETIDTIDTFRVRTIAIGSTVYTSVGDNNAFSRACLDKSPAQINLDFFRTELLKFQDATAHAATYRLTGERVPGVPDSTNLYDEVDLARGAITSLRLVDEKNGHITSVTRYDFNAINTAPPIETPGASQLVPAPRGRQPTAHEIPCPRAP